MSRRTHKRPAGDSLRDLAAVFAALGDPTRLTIVSQLVESRHCSISSLAQSSPLTRQAITKHLDVLEAAGLVRSVRSGRESHFDLKTKRLAEARAALDAIGQQWEDALKRLKAFVDHP